STIVRTRGNSYGHIVLRGGGGSANYDSVSISITEKALIDAKFAANIVVDCSHANSLKDPYVQPLVMADCVHQIREGNQSIVGLMIESNIEGGNQPIPDDLSKLRYGCSVTDPCIDWSTTETTIRKGRDVLKDLLPQRRIASPDR
ncbi:MAG TPA: 3-deoxy-7-phosphoheptulonate synthase, partial [Candidatus Binatia bacterium]